MALIGGPIATFNLAQASIVVLEASQAELDICAQILFGFGCKGVQRCISIAEARAHLNDAEIDLLIVGATLPEGDGYDFVHRLRRDERCVNRFAPVVIVAGHTPRSKIGEARDCGAHFVLRKPLSPVRTRSLTSRKARPESRNVNF